MDTPNQKQQQQQKVAVVIAYGMVSCSVPAKAAVYENRGGGKSTVAVQCSIPLQPQGLIVDAAVWARISRNKSGDDEIQFEAAIPRGMKALDDVSAETFKAHVEAAVVAWNGYPAAEAAAMARLTGEKSKSVVDRPGLAPRLVKKAVTAAA